MENFITGNNVSATDIQLLVNAADPTNPPIVGEDDVAFYRKDAMGWATLVPEKDNTSLKGELEFLASLGVALAPATTGGPWHVDKLAVIKLYGGGGGVTTGIFRQETPEKEKKFLLFLKDITLPAYIGQAKAIARHLPPTIHAGMAARQQEVAAESAIRKISGLLS